MNSKRILAPLLSAASALCLMAQPLSAATFGPWEYTDNGTSITIDAYTGPGGMVEIPATIIGKPVTSIGETAFYSCEYLTSVTIPSGVTSIGIMAFAYCIALPSVTIPNSVTSIGNYAFDGCTGLTSVTIPNRLTSIGEGVFTHCTDLRSVSIPNSVTSIGRWAFSWCGLTSVTIPNRVTSIGSGVFEYCSSLTSVTIPNSVTSIGDCMFYSCIALPSVTIPNSVTSIGVGAFYECHSLYSVTIPNNVTSIGECAFSFCDRLTSVSIPNSVTSIGERAFEYCDSLTNAIFLGNAPSMGRAVFDYTYDHTNSGFTVYYIKGKTGFTSPEWHLYPCFAIDPAREIAVEQPVGTPIADSGSKAFGNVVLGSSTSLTFIIKNTGIANLTGLAITKNGTNAADFTVTANPVSPVGLAGSTTFTVRFAPGAAGTRKAAIHIASNDANENPFDITLTGTGIASPEISVLQPAKKDLKDGVSAVSFGKVAIKKTVTKTFTIRNTGTATLKNLAVTKNGKHAKNFSVKAPLKKSLSPGASTTFKVTFKPSAKGILKAVIHIRSNDGNENPFDLALTGKGMIKASAPSTLATPASLLSRINHQTRPSISATRLADGRKYLTLTVMKSAETAGATPVVKVSPNLIDWFSGGNHTTVITDNKTLLKVRDNTPLSPGKKRYIRMETTRD